MAYTVQTGNYVKFLRGTPDAWKSLTKKDSDTLYFISEKNSSKGSLYLGTKLISSADFTKISTLNEIEDVLIGEGVVNGSLLVYDEDSNKWVNKTVTEVIASSSNIMVGASSSSNGISGLVPTPLKGYENYFLRGDGQWADTGVSSLSKKIDDLIGTGNEGKTIQQIAAIEVAKIKDGAPEAFDTFKEVAEWIQSQPSTAEIISTSEKVKNLENIIYGKPEEKIPIDEDGTIITIPEIVGLTTQVQSLNDLLNTKNTGLVDRVEAIESNLKWQDLVEEF